MCIDHRRLDVAMLPNLLDGSNVRADFEQVDGIVSEGETTDMLDYARFADCFLDGPLKNRLLMEKILCILPGNRFYILYVINENVDVIRV